MRFSARRPIRVLAFELTPMIDVVLQLIIFFMITSQFSKMTRSQIDLPEEAGREDVVSSQEPIIIDIRPDGQLLVESKPITRLRFVSIVTAEIARHEGDASRVRVLIRADRHVSTGAVSEIATDLDRLGVSSWFIGARKPQEGGG